MKKILSILAVAVLVVACGAKTDSKSIEDTFVDYLVQINDAVASGDIVRAESLIAETEEWYGSLSAKEQQEAEQALDKNIDKLNDIYESIDKYDYMVDELIPEE